MKRLLYFFATGWLLTTLAAAAPTASLPRVEMYGRSFVNLALYARGNQLELRWNRPTGTVQLTNRWTNLRFQIDSRQADLNGVKVWLSAPVTPHEQNVFISFLDLMTALDPILTPPP